MTKKKICVAVYNKNKKIFFLFLKNIFRKFFFEWGQKRYPIGYLVPYRYVSANRG